LSIRKGKGFVARIKKLPETICQIFHGWTTPLFVPAIQPIELFFFQRIFDCLCEQQSSRMITAAQSRTMVADPSGGVKKSGSTVSLANGTESEPARSSSSTAKFEGAEKGKFEPVPPPASNTKEVPLMQFQRAMVRLFRILKQPSPDINVDKFDANGNGKVGWYEFCSFWKENQISVRLTLFERVFLTLEDAERSIMGRCMSVIVFLAILISTGCFIISTVPELKSTCPLEGDWDYDLSCKPETSPFFKDADLGCVIFFSVEYGFRLVLSGVMRAELVDRDRQKLLEWMVTEDTIREPNFIRRVSSWFFSPANLIDLAAIMPWFLSKAFENSGGEDSLVIRLIRLTRVIRAIRLGKKFEAVIIVVRSVRRSMRALYVLVLNLILGVIIFGALMYFCEQGSWDKEKRAYLRMEGKEFNETSRKWEDKYNRSPFDSIPACFWWAIVTATTVGYGDMFPTTPAGKAVAGVSMAWSLCVLALPIGVIGNNFSQVWEEYDREKMKERQNAAKEEMMLRRSIAWGDPLHYSRRILLEVWHDPGLSDDDQAEFMGEVDFTLEMPEKEHVTRKITLPLTSNYEKARRRVRGVLTFEYHWRPAIDKIGSDALLMGDLEVNVMMGEDLIAIDWKGSCSSDPYCVVVAYPCSPPADGKMEPVWHRTNTVWDTSNPRWNYKALFDVNWTRAGTANCMAADMRQIGHENVLQSSIVGGPNRKSVAQSAQAPQDLQPSEREKREIMQRLVPELQGELVHLQRLVVPQLRAQIQEVQQDLQLIVSILRKRRGVTGNVANGAMLVDAGRSAVAVDSKQHASSMSARVDIVADASPWTATLVQSVCSDDASP